ncbi:hypothetical protein ACFL43_03050 [Thermodesulfobacteriota bacterium]
MPVTTSSPDKTPLRRLHWYALLAYTLILIASRLPFISAGYGMHIDTWAVSKAAKHIATTGQYSFSRSPGYPVHEILCALIWKGGPAALNGLSAAFSVAGFIIFALILRHYGCRQYALGSLAAFFAPVIYLNSISSKDYVLSLTFVLAALLLVLRRRTLLAGIALGLAAGCRSTYCLMALPLCLAMLSRDSLKTSWRQMLLLCLTGAATALLCFAPVLFTYGKNAFIFHTLSFEEMIFGNYLVLVSRFTRRIWGDFGALAIAVAVLTVPYFKFSNPSLRQSPGPWSFASWLSVIGIYCPLYYLVPWDPAYLIPTIPFVILLLARFLDQRLFIAVCLCIILSSFAGIGKPYGLKAGPIIQDHRGRLQQLAFLEQSIVTIEAEAQKHAKTVVILGPDYRPMSDLFASRTKNKSIQYVFYLPEQQTRASIAAGIQVLYMPSVLETTMYYQKIDLRKIGARPVWPALDKKGRAPMTSEVEKATRPLWE